MSDSVTRKPIIAVKCIIQIAVPPKANDASAIHLIRLPTERTVPNCLRAWVMHISESSEPANANPNPMSGLIHPYVK